MSKHIMQLNQELPNMLKNQGNICISIIVPTHRLSPERRIDRPQVQKALSHARELLQHDYEKSETTALLDALDKLYDSIDFTRNTEGLGLYVSSNASLLVHFPFPVTEKVLVGKSFAIRDILYKANYGVPYFILSLSQKQVQLFKGSWFDLNEITDQNFPIENKDEYSYNPPVRSAPHGSHPSIKPIEKEKSNLEKIRISDFFRKADELLADYLVNDSPLVLLGVEKELPWFEAISVHKKNIIHTVPGNYQHADPGEIGKIAWPIMHAHLQHEREELIKEFEEKTGEHHGINGIQDVWRAAKEGRAFNLLVEKDYCKPGFVKKDANDLFLLPPETQHTIITDAVEDVIKMVLETNGNVYFTENDLLKDYQRIALITRY